MDDEPQGFESVDLKLAWAYVVECGISERHFNEMQSRYRALASTWLLGSFAGIGFVVTQQDVLLPVDALIIAAGIGLVGAVGLIQLWNLDLVVYQRLLGSFYTEGYRLEEKFPMLPQVRHRMLEGTGRRGIAPRVIWFYLTGVLVEIGVATIAVAFNVRSHGSGTVLPVVASGIVLAIGLGTVMYEATPMRGRKKRWWRRRLLDTDV